MTCPAARSEIRDLFFGGGGGGGGGVVRGFVWGGGDRGEGQNWR